jgi:hypothetical protein
MKNELILTALAFLLMSSSQAFALDCSRGQPIQSEKINFYIATQARLEKSLNVAAQRYCSLQHQDLNEPVQLTETIYRNLFDKIQLMQAEACFSCVNQTSQAARPGLRECRVGEFPLYYDFNPEHCSCENTGY